MVHTITVEGQKGIIIGVFKDFHVVDLRGPIVPTIMRTKPADRPIILVKYSVGSFAAIRNEIRAVYKRYESEAVFQATIFGDLTPYSDLSQPSNLVGLAFIIALLLACMGLFGLASFTAENRTKEIGIRKANGATTPSVMRLLLTSYTKWLFISFIIALPHSLSAGKKLSWKVSFPNSNAIVGIFGRACISLRNSITDSMFSNLEGCKPKPGESSQVRII